MRVEHLKIDIFLCDIHPYKATLIYPQEFMILILQFILLYFALADVDECLGNHDCEKSCTDNEGSFECSCPEGYQLNADLRSCDLGKCMTIMIKGQRLSLLYLKLMELDGVSMYCIHEMIGRSRQSVCWWYSMSRFCHSFQVI